MPPKFDIPVAYLRYGIYAFVEIYVSRRRRARAVLEAIDEYLP